MEIINKELLNDDKIKEMKKEFSFGKPYRHILIEDFLDIDTAMKILTALKKEEFEHKESDLFSLSQTADFFAVKNRVLKKFYEFFQSKEFGKWIEEITGINLKIGKIDMNGSLYESCDYLLCHDDQLEKRKIAFVYYLSDFNEKDGGAFSLFDSENGKPTEIAKRYSPVFNSFLMFEVSEKSFHEVEEVLSTKKRYAIGGWLH